MTTQIAVRLADDIVDFLDQSVEAGDAASRAALVTQALEREMRRQAALRDVRTLSAQGTEDDLDGLLAWSARVLDLSD